MDPEAAREYLRCAGALATLSDAALDRLATAAQWIETARGERLVEHLDPAESILFLLSGACRVKLTDAGVRAVDLEGEDVGRHFGEITALAEACGTLEIVALDDSVLAKCPRRALDKERLRTVRLLAELAEEEIDDLAGDVTWIEAARGEEVVTHRDRSDSVFFIVSGACNARLEINAPGRWVMFRRLEAGGQFGEIAALTGKPRTVEVSAADDCLIAKCPRSAFDRLMDANFARSVAVSLATMVTSLTERVFELAAFDMRRCLCAEILRLARTGECVEDGVLVRDMPTHDVLAATIGSSRTEVTKKFAELTKDGLVRQDTDERTLLILDIKRLRKEVRDVAGFLWESDGDKI